VILVIDTTALDKSQAVVTAIGSVTPVAALQELTVGDNEPFTVTFTAGVGGTPAWAGNAGYTLVVGVGSLDVDGLSNQASAILATPIAAGWSGILSLTTQALYDNLKFLVGYAIDSSKFPLQSRVPRARPFGGWFSLQIRVTDPTGNQVTYADLRVYIRSRVMPNAVGTTGVSGLVGGVGGSVAATNGASTQAVTFASVPTIGASFANACNAIYIQAVGPTGVVIAAGATAITKAGFTANYASAIPAVGWTLYVIAAGT